VKRFLFRIGYGTVLAILFVAGAWIAFRNSIVGRSVAVPDLKGKTMPEAIRLAHDVGLRVEEQATRARYDDQVPANRVLLQSPETGSLAKPAQLIHVVVSLGPRELRVPDLLGLPPRAAASRLTQAALQLGPVSWYRDSLARTGIVAQDPEADTPATKNLAVEVLTNRGLPEARHVMPDLIGRDAERMRQRLELFGFRVGSARYEVYEGVPPNTVLKQFPPAGYPISNRDVISLTVSRSSEDPSAALVTP
jgi:beta-lactam-binding protein with PASTA domain